MQPTTAPATDLGAFHPLAPPASRWPRWALFTVLVALQLADVLSTNYGALHGMVEANPLMDLAQRHLGAMWWAPKVAALLLFGGALFRHSGRFRYRRAALALCLAYGLIVANNLFGFV